MGRLHPLPCSDCHMRATGIEVWKIVQGSRCVHGPEVAQLAPLILGFIDEKDAAVHPGHVGHAAVLRARIP